MPSVRSRFVCGEAAVEVLEVGHVRQRGRLVDDRVRRGSEDDGAHGARVEQVELDGHRAEGADAIGVGRVAVRADDLVPVVDELCDEPAPDRAAGAGDENSHGGLLRLCHIARVRRVHPVDTTRRRNVTDGRARPPDRAIRGAEDPAARRGVPDARLAERGRRRRPGGVAAAAPHRREHDRAPRRLAHDRRRPRVAEHAPRRGGRSARSRSTSSCPTRSSIARTGRTPSTRRCSRTPSASRCSSCSTR